MKNKMKEKIKDLINRVDSNKKLTFLATVASTFLCHLMFFVNRFANEDDLLNLVVEKNMIGSGRWMPGNLFSKYNIPIITFVVVMFLLGIISVLIVQMLKIKKKSFMILISLLLSTFPVLAFSFGYTFMIERYIFSLFFSVIAVYFVDKWRYGWLAGAICLLISMGYYQTYISVSIALSLIMIFIKLFENNSFKENFKYILKYILMGIGGVILYLLVTKIIVALNGTELLNYKGMNNLGSLPPISQWGFLIARAYGHVIYFILGRNFWKPFNYAFVPQVILAVLNIFLVILNIKDKKLSRGNLILLVVLFIIFPLSINIFDFLLYESHISSLNIYQFVFLFILPFVLLNSLSNKKIKGNKMVNICTFLSIISTVLLIWNNFSISNLYYTKMRDYNKSTEMLVNRILNRIEMVEGVNQNTKILFGNRQGIYGVREKDEYQNNILLDQGIWDRYIGFYNMPDYEDYKMHIMIKNITGIGFQTVNLEERENIINSLDYEKIPNWPNPNCIKYIDDILVVKIS